MKELTLKIKIGNSSTRLCSPLER